MRPRRPALSYRRRPPRLHRSRSRRGARAGRPARSHCPARCSASSLKKLTQPAAVLTPPGDVDAGRRAPRQGRSRATRARCARRRGRAGRCRPRRSGVPGARLAASDANATYPPSGLITGPTELAGAALRHPRRRPGWRAPACRPRDRGHRPGSASRSAGEGRRDRIERDPLTRGVDRKPLDEAVALRAVGSGAHKASGVRGQIAQVDVRLVVGVAVGQVGRVRHERHARAVGIDVRDAALAVPLRAVGSAAREDRSPLSRSRTWMSARWSPSPSPRFVAAEMNATREPSASSAGRYEVAVRRLALGTIGPAGQEGPAGGEVAHPDAGCLAVPDDERHPAAVGADVRALVADRQRRAGGPSALLASVTAPVTRSRTKTPSLTPSGSPRPGRPRGTPHSGRPRSARLRREAALVHERLRFRQDGRSDRCGSVRRGRGGRPSEWRGSRPGAMLPLSRPMPTFVPSP